MRECWPDGALRALVDRELPAEDLSRLLAHLEECGRCAGRCRELSVRAERVLGLIGELAEPGAVEPEARMTWKPVAPVPAHRNRWAAAAVVAAAVAAGWSAFALLAPKSVQAPAEAHVQKPAALEKTPVAEIPLPDLPSPTDPRPAVAPHRMTPSKPPQRALRTPPARASLAGFVALDDDPIDAGVVMRVALAEGRMQADVIYSPDGRPRAIRLIDAGK